MKLDLDKVGKIGRVLERRALTIGDIMSRAEVSERTAYRWIQVFEDRGCTVIRLRRPGGGFAFKITNAPKDVF